MQLILKFRSLLQNKQAPLSPGVDFKIKRMKHLSWTPRGNLKFLKKGEKKGNLKVIFSYVADGGTFNFLL